MEAISLDKLARSDELLYAEQILNNPLWQQVMQVEEERLIQQWKNTQADETEKREGLYLRYRVFEKFKSIFRGFLVVDESEITEESQK